MAAETPRCSLPELYAFVENFIKERKKSNIKTHSISYLVKHRECLPVFMCEVVRKEEEKPESTKEWPPGTLLTSSLSPMERLSRSQQKLFQFSFINIKYNSEERFVGTWEMPDVVPSPSSS
ncbi:unnamed protein product [Nyctereutes procyonoides]|uniref:(raccoon dog) hypothetical protein n=1 Tax=Nyctereutes procyonoides TaxID=34880 RepID=A0A811YA93_NYCPR|nr:unnamed protein product [Nyctereutes procyonoides]